MRSPFRNQIFLPTAALLVFAVILFTGVSAWHAVEVQRSQTAQHMEAVANALGSATYPLTDDVVRRIGAMVGGDVVVFDADGQIAASTMEPNETLRTALADLPGATETASSPQVLRLETGSYLVSSIQRTHVRRPATLYVILKQNEFPVVWQNSLWPPAVVALVTLLLALLVARLLSGRIARRVDQLSALFSRLAEGDFRPVEPSGRDDELRDLMVSANVLSVQLRSMQQELVTAERLQLLGQLSGGLAHQLKNSIAGARLAIQLHQRRCTTDDPMVNTALAQLALTEEQVLAVVSLKPDSSKASMPQVKETCDLASMVTDVVALLQPHCTHWKSVITLDMPAALPISVVSAQSLKGALLNLMQNAIEAAGVDGTVSCHLKTNEQNVVIDIRDSGPGFADDQQQLLTAFRTTKPEGIGLGLTIAQHAVDQEGGTMSLRRVGDETSVEICLPLHSDNNGSSPDTSSQRKVKLQKADTP